MFRTDNAGTSWIEVTLPDPLGGQAWYDLIMAVDPNNETIVWLGEVRMFRSTSSGVVWAEEGSALHVDHHAVAYRPGSSTEIVFGNDGGVYYSPDANSTPISVTDRNDGYNVTQYVGGDIHPGASSNVLVGGTQDNATHYFDSAGIDAVDTPAPLNCCDGGYAYIDQDDGNIAIGSVQRGRYFQSTTGGASFPGSFSDDFLYVGQDSLFYNPGDLDDINNLLYVNGGGTRNFVCENIGSASINCFWTSIPGKSGKSSAFVISPYNTTTTSTVYFGTTSGQVFKYVATVADGGVVSESVTDLTSDALPSAY